MSDIILSICVPTFNREKKLVRLIDSIDILEGIELVICDDGSSDNTKDIIENHNQKIKTVYEYQENQGRGFALKKSIEMANGRYVIVMDSDDYFLPNALSNICWILKTQRSFKSFVFGIKIFKKNKYIDNLPPDIEANYVSLRGDYNIKYDLKEIVRKDILLTCLYSDDISCRRVPTFLIWSTVAEKINCLSISMPVAVKEYLTGGMTDKGFLLRMECAIPMAELYASLTHSVTYQSVYYRWLMRIMWARYAFHSKTIKYKSLWMKIVILPGFIIYLIDRLILMNFFYRKNDD
jgi:glycosyltransferase involved in cell wall biosynthesis